MTFTQAMDAGVLDYLTHPPTHTHEGGGGCSCLHRGAYWADALHPVSLAAESP